MVQEIWSESVILGVKLFSNGGQAANADFIPRKEIGPAKSTFKGFTTQFCSLMDGDIVQGKERSNISFPWAGSLKSPSQGKERSSISFPREGTFQHLLPREGTFQHLVPKGRNVQTGHSWTGMLPKGRNVPTSPSLGQ